MADARSPADLIMGIHKTCKCPKTPDCKHPWSGNFRGRRISLSKWSGRKITTKTAAWEAYNEFEASIRNGTFSPKRRPAAGAITLRELAAEHKNWLIENKSKSLRTYDGQIKRALDKFGDVPVEQLTPNDFFAFRNELAATTSRHGRAISPATINRMMATLRAMFNRAFKKNAKGTRTIATHPFMENGEVVFRGDLDEESARKVRCTPEIRTRLLDDPDDLLRPLITVAIEAGLRQGEMLALRCRDIKWTSSPPIISVREATAKSGKSREIPISTRRLTLELKKAGVDARTGKQKNPDDLLFTYEDGRPIKVLRPKWICAVLRAHGIEIEWVKPKQDRLTPACQKALDDIDLRWHDLRHEFASRLSDMGTPVSIIQKMLGHASLATTERYISHSASQAAGYLSKQDVDSDGSLPTADAANAFVDSAADYLRRMETDVVNVALSRSDPADLGENFQDSVKLPEFIAKNWLGRRETHGTFAVFCLRSLGLVKSFELCELANSQYSSCRHRLPALAGSAGAMTLKMALAPGATVIALVSGLRASRKDRERISLDDKWQDPNS